MSRHCHCKICANDQAEDVLTRLQAGSPQRATAVAAGVSLGTVQRHVSRCLSDDQRAAIAGQSRRSRPCRICTAPEVARVVSQMYAEGASVRAMCAAVKVSRSVYTRHCLKCITAEQSAARAAAKPRRARRTTDIDTAPSLHSAARPTDPAGEAEGLFALCSADGQSMEIIRKGIPVSETERAFLMQLLDCAPLADSIAAYRAEVLVEFDKLCAAPPASLQEEVAASRERVRRTNLRNAKKRDAVDAPTERHFKYKAAAERSDWASV
jgi:transposase-like protein